MSMSMIPVPFRGDTILCVEQDGRQFVAVKPICESFGLAWQPQHRKLTEAQERWGVTIMMIPSAGGPQETVCVPRQRIWGWLNSIHPAKVKPEVRERLVEYQRHCDEVLDAHFMAREAALREDSAVLQALRQFVLAEKPVWSKIDRYDSLGYNPALIADLIGRSAEQTTRLVAMLRQNGVMPKRRTDRAYDEPLPAVQALRAARKEEADHA